MRAVCLTRDHRSTTIERCRSDAADWIERYRRVWEEADTAALVVLFTSLGSAASRRKRMPACGGGGRGHNVKDRFLETSTATRVGGLRPLAERQLDVPGV